MRFLIAPDSFKESCSAREAAAAIADGLRAAIPGLRDGEEIDLCPIADGGEGTVEALATALEGVPGSRVELHDCSVQGPIPGGPRVITKWGCHLWDDFPKAEGSPGGGTAGTAFAEMALAAGLHLVPPAERDPLKTTTYGVGELLQHMKGYWFSKLASQGEPPPFSEVLIGLGGSATVDGAAGAAQACGYRFLDRSGEEFLEPVSGGDLINIASIDSARYSNQWPPKPNGINVVGLCDVENPLLGSNGAAAIFGPQKGASPNDVKTLEAGLKNISNILNSGVAETPGSGAAGGFGAGILGFFDGELRSGADTIFDLLDIPSRLEAADIVIIGEGRFDEQSLFGKGPGRLFRLARKAGKKVVIIAGQVALPPAELARLGIYRAYSLMDRASSVADSQRRTPKLLHDAARRLGNFERSRFTR